jgi:tRNA modification GTPase
MFEAMKPICALASPLGRGGIAIIRISGSNVFKLVSVFFKKLDLESLQPNTIHFARFIDSNKVIDEIMIAKFRSPKSYTGEDMLEISCHCNRIIVESILSSLHQKGIILAEPGEFTKRAFLNGKMDLSQAEAISDLIHGTNEIAVQNSLNILQGKLSRIVSEMKDQMLKIAGLLEIDLDFSEEDLDLVDRKIVQKKIAESIETIDRFIKKSSELRYLNEGIHLAIVGKPNAGKSSLLNAILGRDRAIVSDIEGTTRDRIEEQYNLDGIPVKLVDTAGIRDTEDKIEKLGVNLSYKSIEQSDCVILVVDSLKGISPEDQAIIGFMEKKNKKYIIVYNKSDLNEVKTDMQNSISVSALKENNIELLKDLIKSILEITNIDESQDIIISNLRHELALKNAVSFLEKANSAIENGFGNEIIAVDIRDAITELAVVTGEISSTDVLNNIFANFCIGK